MGVVLNPLGIRERVGLSDERSYHRDAPKAVNE